MLKTTVLNTAHRALGARMVDFGGWEMPLHYGSQIEEHHAVRRDCGMFDVSHMCAVEALGPDVKTFLLRLIANDIGKLKTPGKALYSTLLNEAGGVVDDLIVYYLSDTHYRLVINAGSTDKDLAWMAERLCEWRLDVCLIPLRTGPTAVAMIAVQGPHAKARVWEVLPEVRPATEKLGPFFAVEVGPLCIATTGYTGEEGFELTVPAAQAEDIWNALLAAGVKPCGLGARDTLRLEAGMNLYGQDMDESVSPLDAGLAWTVDLASERDFVGKAALLEKGQQRQFLGLKLLTQGVLRAHQKVVTAQGEGDITSGSFSPTLGCSIAFARLPLGVAIGDRVKVEIRGKRLDAEVTRPLFVRHGKALI